MEINADLNRGKKVVLRGVIIPTSSSGVVGSQVVMVQYQVVVLQSCTRPN